MCGLFRKKQRSDATKRVVDRKGQVYDIPVNPDGTVPREALEARSAAGHSKPSGLLYDLAHANKTTYPINAPPEQLLPWWKKPARYDVEGIDALPGAEVKKVRKPREKKTADAKKSVGWSEPEKFVDDPKLSRVVTFKEVKSNGKTYRLSATAVFDDDAQQMVDCYANVKCQDTNEFFGPFPAKTLQDAKRAAVNYLSQSNGSGNNVTRPAGAKKEVKPKKSTPKKTEPVKAVPVQKKESDFLKEHVIIAAPAPVVDETDMGGFVIEPIPANMSFQRYEGILRERLRKHFVPDYFTIYTFEKSIADMGYDPNDVNSWGPHITRLSKYEFIKNEKAQQYRNAEAGIAACIKQAKNDRKNKDAADMAAMRERVAAKTPAEPVPVTPTPATYYSVSEEQAKYAKESYSFSDYKQGSESAGYKARVDEVVEYANQHKAKIDPMYWGEVDKAVDRWSKWYADWINRENAAIASCPSPMITGRSGYNWGKHEKAMTGERKLAEEYYQNKDIEQKIRSIGTGGISSTDVNARAKIEQKIVKMQDEHDSMVRINKAVRGGEGSKAYEALSEDEKKEVRMRIKLNAGGYKDWELSNNGAEIRRLKGRLEQLDHEDAVRAAGGGTYDTSRIDGLEIVEDSAEGRIKLIFDAKPHDAARAILKSNGFRWSPRNNAWQCFLTDNGRHAVKRVLETFPEDWRE